MGASDRVEAAIGIVSALRASRLPTRIGASTDALSDAVADMMPALYAEGPVRATLALAALVEAAIHAGAHLSGMSADDLWREVAAAARDRAGGW